MMQRRWYALFLVTATVCGAARAADPAPVPSNAWPARLERGLAFLTNLFEPSLELLPEFRGARVCWLYHDNYLAAKLLEPARPDLARRIRGALERHGARASGKIEILFGEAREPLPFRLPLLTNVARAGAFEIRTEIVTPTPHRDWTNFADLRLFAALALVQTDRAEARRHLAAAESMWDGHGFDDPPRRKLRVYAAYKLALLLLAERRLEVRSPLHEAARARLLAQQSPGGGWITDYRSDGTAAGLANVETTCLALLALEQPR